MLKRAPENRPADDGYHPWTTYIDARQEARRRGDHKVGTEHLVLALLMEPPSKEMRRFGGRHPGPGGSWPRSSNSTAPIPRPSCSPDWASIARLRAIGWRASDRPRHPLTRFSAP